MSRLLLSLCVLLALACLSVLVAANCSTGESEITTPGLLDGIVPETGELMQQPALTLTLWPISLSLLPQVNGNVTDFVGAFGQCQAATGCATGKIQLGLYHFHLVGTFNPNEAGKVHLIYYSDIITYHPHFQGRAPNTVIEYKKAAAHPQVPSEPLIPFPEGNPFTGYFIGILSTVPYGIYFGGASLLPVVLTKHDGNYASDQMLPGNPELQSFTFTPSMTEASLGFFYCPNQ